MPREVGEWTNEKLKYLSTYLPVYLKATTKALERIYIDAFAGPGINALKESGKFIDGSPLIALEATADNGTVFDRLFFIESDRDAARELSEIAQERDQRGRVEVIPGDVNEELPKLISRLPRKSPTFVFLDPEGIDPRWSTIKALSPWRTELLINFPLGMAIKRNLNSSKVTDYFGTDDWMHVMESAGPEGGRRLLDFYKERLKDLGWEYTTDADPEIAATGGQRLYHLVFVSKVEPGARIMKWVHQQPDARGQLRFKF